MPFDITSLQRSRGATQAKSRADEQGGRAALKYIDVYDLIPSEDNFYAMSAIEELASLIEISGGVKQPGLVVPLGGGKYRVIAGHRRRLASISLVEQGKEQFRRMPCMVERMDQEGQNNTEEAGEAARIQEIDEGILLIATNSQREKTDWERVQEATKLRELLEQKRRIEKVPGQTRKIIAEKLGTTPAQISRYESIARHLIPEFQDELAEGRVNISVAYELSTMPETEQAKALQEYRQKGALSLEDTKRRKTKDPELVEEKMKQTISTVEPDRTSALSADNNSTKKAESEKKKQSEQEEAAGEKYYNGVIERVIKRLDDLYGFCAGMAEVDDKTRDWASDAAAIKFTMYALEK